MYNKLFMTDRVPIGYDHWSYYTYACVYAKWADMNEYNRQDTHIIY